MGTDMHFYAEKKNGAGGWGCPLRKVFDWRSYSIYGFLADVRNCSAVKPIREEREMLDMGDPVSPTVFNLHNDEGEWWKMPGDKNIVAPGWDPLYVLPVELLLSHDYDTIVEDRRWSKRSGVRCSGPDTCGVGQGVKMTLREFLGEGYFSDLERLRESGAERLVYWISW